MKKSLFWGLLLITNFAFCQTWQTNFEEAKKEASANNKNILLVFSGSDWCGPCMKLEKNIWETEVFKQEALKSWVLVRADFPKKKANQLKPELAASNNILAEKYNKNGYFPLVVLIDKTGKTIGMTSYKNIDANQYIAELHTLEKK